MGEKDAREGLAAEIERLVINSVRAGSIVRTSYFAGMLADKYKDANYSVGHIVDAIACAAAEHGIPVEINRPSQVGPAEGVLAL
jgi:hypothetical protein